MNSVKALAQECFAYWAPPPDLTLSQWADEKFYLSAESAAEPGKWRTYSYQKGLLDAFTDPANRIITIKKSARIGYTKAISCAVGYYIEHDPCSQLIVQPTITDANGYSKDEIQPMLRDVPCLFGKVAEAKSRDSNNTILKKLYPGGTLSIVGANSATGFRRITVRIVYFDEVDGYPATAGQEGDQIKLGAKRTETFWNGRIALGSTPTVSTLSRIQPSFMSGDQRYYNVPCPFCKHEHRLEFKNMKWPEGNPERAYFLCPNCEKEIEHSRKRAMIDAGHWVATEAFTGHASFHIWAAYSFSPGATWGAVAKRFADATHYFKNTGDDSALRTVINTDFGEVYEDKGEGIDSVSIQEENIYDSAEETIPDDISVITMGVDVQHDRIEAEIVGWKSPHDFTNWSLDYAILEGDTSKSEVWEKLDDEIGRFFKTKTGKRPINCVAIDSSDGQGKRTQHIYDFVETRQKRRVFAIKGSSKSWQPIVGRATKQGPRKNILLYPVGTDTAKDQIFSLLERGQDEKGYCHFPDKYDQEYFDQLTAEQKFTVHKRGVKQIVYRKIRKRNEALDCRVYALAALYIARSMVRKKRRGRRVIHGGVNK